MPRFSYDKAQELGWLIVRLSRLDWDWHSPNPTRICPHPTRSLVNQEMIDIVSVLCKLRIEKCQKYGLFSARMILTQSQYNTLHSSFHAFLIHSTLYSMSLYSLFLCSFEIFQAGQLRSLSSIENDTVLNILSPHPFLPLRPGCSFRPSGPDCPV